METAQTIKDVVKEKYSDIVNKANANIASSCCGSECGTVETEFGEDYSSLKGYAPEADLGLGCGLPTEFAKIKEGDTVVDLGSGAGNDCFIAREFVGDSGKVIGVDMTREMVAKAWQNAVKLGAENVEFRLGDIESLPVDDNTTDVVVSNCVLNLVPDKEKAFGEMFRILKPGGHFSVSDIVLQGELPEKLQNAAAVYTGCVAGASQKSDYLRIIEESGFNHIEIQKERQIELSDKLLTEYLNDDEIAHFKNSDTGVFSITVYGEKPV